MCKDSIYKKLFYPIFNFAAHSILPSSLEEPRIPERLTPMGRAESCGSALQSDSRRDLRTTLLSECLVPLSRSPLAPDGQSSRQRVRTYFNRCSGLWQNDLPASHAASSSASVLSRSSQSLQQVRQGDGSDKQSAGQPR